MENRIVKINNYINSISTKEIEREVSATYDEIFPKSIKKTCRICLEQDDEEYISPCLCKGTQKYIHRSCLNQWREVNRNNPEKRNSCEICKYKFKFFNANTIDFSKFLLKKKKYYIVHFLFAWFLSMIILWFDILNDFFLIKTLNFYSSNNSSLIIIFRDIKNSEEVFYMNYSLFYIFCSCYICIFLSQIAKFICYLLMYLVLYS